MQTFVIKPSQFFTFDNETEQIDMCREWGLLSGKATKTKDFYYKGGGAHLACRIVGFVDKMTAVIEFEDGRQHCIHPSYLKEMQASSYGQKSAAAVEESAESDAEGAEQETLVIEAKPVEAEAAPAKGKAKKEKAAKLQLPEEKVKMTATVQEFTTVPNHFTETDDEVVIYEAVSIVEPAMELGAAWSSHSATLKKMELAVGDVLEFEAKVAAKKLTKHPVPYKINNPSKIRKAGSD